MFERLKRVFLGLMANRCANLEAGAFLSLAFRPNYVKYPNS